MNMKIEYIPIAKLKLNPKNPRQITKKAFDSLVKSLKDCPQLFEARPLLVSNRTGESVILGGNMRYRAAQKLGYKQMPCIIMSGLNENQEKEIAIKDNGAWGEWDWDILANEWSDFPLNNWGLDIPKDWLKSEKEVDVLSDQEESLIGLGEVFDLRHDVRFDGEGKFDIPKLKPDKMLDIKAPIAWAGPHASKKVNLYLYNYNTDSTIGLDFSKTVVSFYTEDFRFEKLWNNTREIAIRFLNSKIIGMISPNFSTYFFWPRALRLYNVFRSRWVARYMQETGIKIIPDISGHPDDIEFLFDGIPIYSPICIQVHRNIGTEKDIEYKNIVIEEAIKHIKPKRIWIYGTEDKIIYYKALENQKINWIIPRQKYHQDFKKEKIDKTKKI